MKYYLIVGEASGDLHASNLMQGIKNSDPDAEFRFFGGDLMADKGGTLVKHYRSMSFMGFWEVLVNLKQVAKNLKFCKNDIVQFNPDAVILVDYPGFNLRIAKFAKQLGLKVFYYISPKVWAWKSSRVKAIKKYVDRLLIIFPFEIEYFKQRGVDAVYCGNPLVDTLDSTKNPEFRKQNSLGEKPIVAVLAGSRAQEIKHNLLVMISMASKLTDYQLVIAGAPSLDMAIYQPYISGTDVKIVFEQTQELLKHSVAAMVTSGTATLEAALFNVPEVVCYRGSLVSVLIAALVVKVKFISLVNLIMDREVVTELIQFKLNEENLYRELANILPGSSGREAMLKSFAELRDKLGKPGASQRFADVIVSTLKQLNTQ
ncbi:MAG TPA: lipid-A-disaccharide synthase [Perlabentimonas sp.]|nr:lipid-A-disaccharide synthase [Bacteroidales bacterium]MDD4672571.1 lipid-A-disaccharide synthase [Bacteroidales bacterium]MDY0348149.1 lipid-A-disaccharide synthase [Tenuifilaceae bacterium]HZJ74012.1 lipid-A-disaccharide synthase [Perlabentimonas sp.]